MSELRYVTAEEQIAAINAAVDAGYAITAITVSPTAEATIRFTRFVPREPLIIGARVFAEGSAAERQTVDFGCGLVAMEHARRLMDEAVHLRGVA